MSNTGYWTAKRRQELVLRLLRSETTMAEEAQKYDLTVQEIESWFDKALAAMENALSLSPQHGAEQDYLRDLAMIGLLYGESFHYARNRLGMAKTLAANITAGHYDRNPKAIKHSAAKIINCINDYLGILEQSQAEVSHRADGVIIDIHELLDQIIHSKRIPAWIAIHTNFHATDPRIHAPPRELRQVFQVLFQNAVDAITDTDRLAGMIVSTDEHNDGKLPTIEVTISNSGRAIPLELREDVLSFFKEPKSTGRAQRLGLGLAWANAFLRIHGGQITYETSDEGGTTFHLYLPRTFKAMLG